MGGEPAGVVDAASGDDESHGGSCYRGRETRRGTVRFGRLGAAKQNRCREYFRRAVGPGWALVGDAGHFKHPATGQGIGDAVGQAWFVADALLGADPELATYQWWRDERAAEHYEWSYRAAHWPDPERIGPMFAGLVADPPAAQQWRDLFTRRTRPSEVASSFLRLDVVVQVNHAVRVVCNLDYGKPFVILCSLSVSGVARQWKPVCRGWFFAGGWAWQTEPGSR
jgi:hypothetical protein